MKMIAVISMLAFLTPLAESAVQRSDEEAHSWLNLYSPIMTPPPTAEIISERRDAVITPVEKVLQMIYNLKAKVVKEEKEQYLLYDQETALCAKHLKAVSWLVSQDEMKILTEQGIIDDDKATIVQVFSRLDQLRFTIAADEQRLRRLQKTWANESSHMQEELSELDEVIMTMQGAISSIEASKPSLLQTNRTMNIVQALSAMVEASAIQAEDAEKVAEFMQTANGANADSNESQPTDEVVAPEADAYTSKTGDIVTTLEEMVDTADKQRFELMATFKKEEIKFNSSEFILINRIKLDKEELADLKKQLGITEEDEASAENTLWSLSKTLLIEKDARKLTEQECLDEKHEFEVGSQARLEEMQALSKAETAIKGATNSTAGINFLQLQSRSHSQLSAMDGQLVDLVRELGHKHKDRKLLQLSVRLAQVIRHSGAIGQDPFAKVKVLIDDMIKRLEEEAEEEATKQAWCEEELAKFEKDKKEKEEVFDEVKARLDKAKAELNKVRNMLKALAESAASAAETEAAEYKLRQELHNEYLQTKMDDEKGLDAVRAGMEILKDYYEKDKDENGATIAHKNDLGYSNIYSLLEVIEQDIEKSLVALEETEKEQADHWAKSSQQYAIERAINDKDTRAYKAEEGRMKAEVDYIQADLDAVIKELTTITKYIVDTTKECQVTPAVQYKEKVARMQAEIDGLKDGLDILEGETVLLQGQTTHKSVRRSLRRSVHRSLRGISRH